MNKQNKFLQIILSIIFLCSYSKEISFHLKKDPQGEFYYGVLKRQNESNKNVIFDTASDLLTIPCDNKKEKLAYQNKDDERNIFEMVFVENTHMKGKVVFDNVLLMGKTGYSELIKTEIGCIRHIAGDLFLRPTADGIIGLNHNSRFFTWLENGGSPKYNILVCLGDYQGNVELFQEELSEEWDLELHYLEIFNSYSVLLDQVLLNDKIISIDEDSEEDFDVDADPINFYLIFDIGCTFITVPEHLYNNFFQTLNEFCTDKNNCAGFKDFHPDSCIDFQLSDNKFKSLEAFLKTFPILKLQIKQKILNIYPKEYFFIRKLKSKPIQRLCFGIRMHLINTVVLGNNSLKNKNIFFDRQNKMVKIKRDTCIVKTASTLQIEIEKKII